MHPSTAISAPSQAAPAAPRAQRPNNRKSGLTAALQKQSQASQGQQPQHQSQPRNGNNPRHHHAQRATNPEQAHSRHQSMPPQQRGSPAHINSKADMSNVSILKRSSAAPAPKSSPVAHDTLSSKQPPQSGQVHQQQQHHRNHLPNQKPRPQSQQQQQQQQQQQPPSKARRVQRRREVQVDLDQAMQQSPPLDPSSPPSSSDSDDSESALSRLPANFLHRQLASSPPHRPSSAPAAPQPRHGYQNNMDVTHQGSVFAHRSPNPMDMLQRPNFHAAKANSADKVLLVEKKSTLYAGPTFHNSPAPTSLPIPAFARSAGNSPAEPSSVERLPSAPFFAEAASPQLNSMRPQTMPSTAPGWAGHHSMPMSMPMSQSYNVPERMATSSFTPHMSVQNGGVDHLMEISQSLRNLLKIQSQ